MFSQNEIFFIGAIVVLLGFSIYLIIAVFGLRKRIKQFFREGEKDFEEVVNSQIKAIGELNAKTGKASEEIENIKKTFKKNFQKFGIIRFNPFKGMGSDQSFSIALFDGQNNGFVISSLYGRDGNRVYAKLIKNGQSEYQLSEEEKKVIEQAKTGVQEEEQIKNENK